MPSVQCSFIDKVVWETLEPKNYELSDSTHIWRLQLSANITRIAFLEPLLSPDEVVRARSYLQEKDRNRFILSRGMLRSILAKYINQSAESILFSTGENNKPFVQSSTTPIHYNVSHAGDWALIAVSASPAGADIEYINQDLDYSEVLPICFSKEEISFIQSRKQFYLLWTRKESLVKATGKGIDDDLPYVPCMNGVHEALPQKIGSDRDWEVVSFEIGDEYIGSVTYDTITRGCFFFEATPKI